MSRKRSHSQDDSMNSSARRFLEQYQSGSWRTGAGRGVPVQVDRAEHALVGQITTAASKLTQERVRVKQVAHHSDLNIRCQCHASSEEKHTYQSVDIASSAEAHCIHVSALSMCQDAQKPTPVCVLVSIEEHHLLALLKPLLGDYVCRASLNHGDLAFVVDGCIVLLLERKTVGDLLTSIKSHHFQRQRNAMCALPMPSSAVGLLLEWARRDRDTSISDQTSIFQTGARSPQDMARVSTCVHRLQVNEGMCLHQTFGLLGTISFVVGRLTALSEVGLGLGLGHSGPCVLVKHQLTSRLSIDANSGTVEATGLSVGVRRVEDQLVPCTVPSEFRLGREGDIPPGHFLCTIVGTARKWSFFRALAIRSHFLSLKDLVLHLEEMVNTQGRDAAVQYLATFKFVSKGKTHPTRRDEQADRAGQTSSQTKQTKQAAPIKKTAIGKRCANSLLNSLGF